MERVRDPHTNLEINSRMSASVDTLPASAPAIWKPKHNPWAIALVVTMATFMEVLDTTIANVALPHIAGNLSASQDESAWILSSYLVANAVILPISAWLATRFGRKRFYMTCVVLFGLSSLACGFATSLGSARFFPDHSGTGRRRPRAQRTGDTGGHLPAAKTWNGVRDLWNGGGAGARDRSYAGRLYHRQFRLALDLLHQRASGDRVADFDLATGGRSAVPQEDARENRARRLCRPAADRGGSGRGAGGARSRPARRLVRIQLHPGVPDYFVGVHRVRHLLGIPRQESDHRPAAVSQSQFRGELHPDVHAGRGAVRFDRAAAPNGADADGLHSAAGGYGALARCDRDHSSAASGRATRLGKWTRAT